MNNEEEIIFSVRLSRDLHKRLKMAAVHTEQTCQDILRALIEDYLECEEGWEMK